VGVDKKGKKKSITLQEANFPPNMGAVQKRKITGKKIGVIEKKLHIVGYYKP